MKNRDKLRPTRAQKIAAAKAAKTASPLVAADFAALESNPAVRTAKAAEPSPLVSAYAAKREGRR